MVGEACLLSNAYSPRTPDYTLYSGVHVCWSEHSNLSFVYGFMSLDYGLGTMTATTLNVRTYNSYHATNFTKFSFKAILEVASKMQLFSLLVKSLDTL